MKLTRSPGGFGIANDGIETYSNIINTDQSVNQYSPTKVSAVTDVNDEEIQSLDETNSAFGQKIQEKTKDIYQNAILKYGRITKGNVSSVDAAIRAKLSKPAAVNSAINKPDGLREPNASLSMMPDTHFVATSAFTPINATQYNTAGLIASVNSNGDDSGFPIHRDNESAVGFDSTVHGEPGPSDFSDGALPKYNSEDDVFFDFNGASELRSGDSI
jgi:hypothetical protein